MVKMPGVPEAQEQWDPMTEAISARESKPYKPRMGTQAIQPPPENVNPYDQFVKEGGERAQRVEPDSTLTERFTQHFMESQRGGTKGLGQVGEIVLENDPARKQYLVDKYKFEKSQYEGMPAAETPMDYLAAIGGELAGGVVDPLNLIPVAKVGTVGWRASRPFVSRVIDQSVSGAAMNAAANTSLQALEVGADLREEIDPWEVAIQTAVGGVAGAGFGTIDGSIAWRQKKAEDFYKAQIEGGDEPLPDVEPQGRPAIGVTLKGQPEGPMTPIPDPEEVRTNEAADAFIKERGLTAESVEALPEDAKAALNADWQAYRDQQLAAPASPTVEGLTKTYGPGRLSAAQETLFGEVIGTRNLTPEQLAQVENHLQGASPETVPQQKIETEGADQAQPVSQLTPDTETGARVDTKIDHLPVGPYRQFAPEELKVDAKRFQFKEGADEAGVTDRLKGVKKWDPTKAGQTLVWESKEGDFFIADGHQRHGLATRLAGEGQDAKIPAYVLRETDGVTAEDARAIAAAKNIAEGTGSAVDAAKILRTRPDIGVDLPPMSALVRDAQGLAKLSDDAFGMVINKKVPAGYAAIVGKLADDKATHAQLLDLLAKEKPENAIEAESMVRDALEAPAVQSTMEDMFGSAEVTQILFKERAQVLSAAATAIRKDRAAFSTLVREEERIQSAGNKLATGSNLERAQQDAEILAQLQTQARRKGPVADALAQAAQRLKEGEPRQTVVRDFLGVLRGETAPDRADGGNVGPQERPIAASLTQRNTDSPAFKRWFGDSKVVDEAGEPLVAYKAMQGDTALISPETGMSHVALDRKTAQAFAEAGRPIQEVYVKAEKPFDFRNAADLKWLTVEMRKLANVTEFNRQTKEIMGPSYDHEADARQIVAGLEDGAYQIYEVPLVSGLIRKRGYDAIYMVEEGEAWRAPNLAVFEPSQIKSIFNRGSWDAADPRIAFAHLRPNQAIRETLNGQTVLFPDDEHRRLYRLGQAILDGRDDKAEAEALFKIFKGFVGEDVPDELADMRAPGMRDPYRQTEIRGRVEENPDEFMRSPKDMRAWAADFAERITEQTEAGRSFAADDILAGDEARVEWLQRRPTSAIRRPSKMPAGQNAFAFSPAQPSGTLFDQPRLSLEQQKIGLRELSAKYDAENKALQANIEAALKKDGAFTATSTDGRSTVVTPSLRNEGLYQITYFDKTGEATGHMDSPLRDLAKDTASVVGRKSLFEPGADGKPQIVIPGAERITDRVLAERRGAEPMRAAKSQKPLDFGLFGDDSAQLDLLDVARQKVAPRLRPKFDEIDWRPDGAQRAIRIGDSHLVYSVSSDGVELQSIRTPVMRRGQGAARDAMEVFLEGADALNLTVRLWAQAMDDATIPARLMQFYEGLGFEATGGRAGRSVEMIRAPDGRDMPLDEAGLRALVNDNAPVNEIETHPLILDSIRRMAELPLSHERPGYGTPEDRATRLFDFDGEMVRGVDEAVDRLVQGAMSFSTDGPVRQEARATIILGPAAAGKSTIAEDIAARRFMAIVDPDEAKKVMPEYRGGLGANAVHEESSDIGSEVLSRLADARMNMVLPKVGKDPRGIEKLTLALQRLGYHVEIVSLAVSYENAFRRMINRYLKTGRLIDPQYVKAVGEKPAETYRTLREKGVADGYAEIDGNGLKGEDALIRDETPGVLDGLPGFRRDRDLETSLGTGQAGRGEGAPARQTQDIAARLRPQQQSPVPTNRAQTGTAGKPAKAERLEAISADLADLASLPIPVRQGRLQKFKGGKAAGQYDRNQGVIRMREMSDFETQTHETGHALETEYGRDLAALQKAHAGELDAMAYSGADPKMITSEGFAEWLRFYVSNPGYAARTAPNFTSAFTEFLRQRNPDQLARLESIAERYRAWATAPSTAVVAADVVSTRRMNPISELVAEGQKDGWRAVIGRYMDKAYATSIDKLHPINRAVSTLLDIYEAQHGSRLDLKMADNPYVHARLLQDSYAAGHIDQMHGVVPYHETMSEGPGLADGLEVMLGKQYIAWDDALMADVAAYLISRRAVHEYERFFNGEIPNVPGKFTLGDYETTILELEAAHPEWVQGAEMIYDWERNLLRKKREAGFLTEKQYQDFLKKPAYVPFQRDLSDIDKIDTPAGRATGTLRDSIVKAFKGSKRSVINPIESMMKDAYEVNARIKRNDTFKALRDLAKMVGPGGGSIAEIIPDKELRGTSVNVEELIRSAAKGAGIAEDDVLDLMSSIDTKLGEDAMGTIFRAGDINEKGEPIIYVWEDGRRQAMRLADGEFGLDLYNAMTGMNKEAQNIFVSALALPSTAVRYGITTAPHFIMANYIRDQMSAWVLTGNNFIPFISGAAGLRDELTQAEVTRIYNTFGGIMGGGNVAALDKGRGKRDIKALQKQGYSIRRFANIRGFAEFTELTETGTRLAVFKNAFNRARREGLNDYEAAMEAAFSSRDYIDFGRHGSQMLTARRLVPFLNASLQGLDKTIRTLAPAAASPIRAAIAPFVKWRTGSKLSRLEHNALATSATAWAKMTAIGMFGLGLSYMYRDDPEYEEISDYLRATHWMVKISPGKWAAIPKPFEIGFISNAFERSFDAIYGRDPIAAQNFFSGLYEVTAPPTGIPIFETYYELKHNVDSQGREIVGPDIAGYDPWRQYTSYTSELAKQIGAAVNVSPAKIDHAIQGFGASWGKIVADGSTDIANEEGILTTIINSVSRRFTRDVARGNTSSRAFWDLMSESTGPLTQTANTFKELYESKGEPEAERYLSTKSENQKVYALMGLQKAEVERLHPMRRAKDMMSVISRMRRDIAGNDVVKLDTAENKAEEQERVTLTPSMRQQAQDILSKLSMVEARNALIVIGEPGWAQRELMDRQSLVDELRLALPELADEFDARVEKKKVYDFDAVRESWPDAKERALQDRQDADYGDLVAGAK